METTKTLLGTAIPTQAAARRAYTVASECVAPIRRIARLSRLWKAAYLPSLNDPSTRHWAPEDVTR